MRAKFAILAVLIAGCLTASGCAKRKSVIPRPPYAGDISGDSERLQESLFKGDQAVLSNQEIERILSGHISVADRRRLAVLGLTSRSLWSQSIAEADAQNSERLLQTLKSSPQLTQVRIMPALLIPEKRTVPYLREAAARFQADLLLVYTTRIQTFRRDRLLGPDEVRARCLAESVLLDVRTGIVAHTARATESIAVKKTSADLNFGETIAKAESDAVGKALVSLANELTAYLGELQK